MKYARVLLYNRPEETTELFIQYYKGTFRPRTEVESPVEPQEKSGSTLQSLAAFLPLSLMSAGSGKTEVVEPPSEAEVEDTEPAPAYHAPKPRTAFSAFVGHSREFITFLEALIEKNDLKQEDKIDLYTTLFEMYLDTASHKKDTEKEEWESKAKKLIEGKDVRHPPRNSSPLYSSRLDTHLHIQRAAPLRPIRLPRGVNSRPRAGGSAVRYFPIIYISERHARCYQGSEEVRPGRAPALHRRPDVFCLESKNPGRSRRRARCRFETDQ